MRLSLERYSGTRGFTPEQFRQSASEVAGTDLSSWLQRALETTEELNYEQALDWFGLQFRPPSSPPTDAPGWLGAHTRIEEGRLVVSEVPRGTPAYEAGVNAGDEVLAIDELRVLADQLDTRLASYRPGRKVSLLIARREELKRLDVTLGLETSDRWALEVRPDATAQQQAHQAAWLRQ
jgi:predicted metalloprotease with PDZ domain